MQSTGEWWRKENRYEKCINAYVYLSNMYKQGFMCEGVFKLLQSWYVKSLE